MNLLIRLLLPTIATLVQLQLGARRQSAAADGAELDATELQAGHLVARGLLMLHLVLLLLHNQQLIVITVYVLDLLVQHVLVVVHRAELLHLTIISYILSSPPLEIFHFDVAVVGFRRLIVGGEGLLVVQDLEAGPVAGGLLHALLFGALLLYTHPFLLPSSAARLPRRGLRRRRLAVLRNIRLVEIRELALPDQREPVSVIFMHDFRE